MQHGFPHWHWHARQCVYRLPFAAPAAKRAKAQHEHVDEMLAPRARNTTSAGRGPREALSALDFGGMKPSEVKAWTEEARMDAILGSCRLSIKSVKSGVRCYVAFAGELNKRVRICTACAHCYTAQTHWNQDCGDTSRRNSTFC